MATTNFVSWLVNNIGSATWWRSKALSQGVTDEGGVDVPLPANTPIYALATGPLKGFGYFYHGGPYFSTQRTGAGSNPGYGVVSEQVNVPGVGLEDLYYQHINLAPNIPFCQGGNCGGYIVQKGQLLGLSNSQLAMFGTGGANSPGEAEIGLGANKSWGGIWGNPNDPGSWISDPRQALVNLAGGGGPVTSTTAYTPNSPLNPYTGQSNSNCPWYCAFVPSAIQTSGPCASCPGSLSQTVGPVVKDVTDPGWWARVGIILLGGILVLVGVMKLVK